VAATLRFAGGLHIVGGQIVVEAELDTAQRRPPVAPVRAEVYGHKSDVLVMSASGLRKSSRYVVRIVEEGATLRPPDPASSTPRGRPGPWPAPQGRQRVACDSEAAWRGAFLAHGSLTEPGRSSPSR
jgi:DNA-binding protein WhiA